MLSSDTSTPATSSRLSASPEQLSAVTHLDASMASVSTTRSSRGSGRKKIRASKELSKAVSNDGLIPWLRSPITRGQEFHTVETLPAFTLFTSSTTVPVYAAQYFYLGQVIDATSFASVFDQYRIREIEILIEPAVTEVTAPTGDVGEFISVVDIDDANVPTLYGDLGSYPTALQTKGTIQHYHRWVPSVAIASFSGAFTSYAATTSMWLDCGSPNIQHYGIKAGSLAATVAQSYTVQAKLHLSFRARH